MPELRRSEAGRALRQPALRATSAQCEPAGLDGLIVTGAEPRAAELVRRTLLAHHDESHRLGGGPHHFDRMVVSCGARCSSAFATESSPPFRAEAFGRIRVREGRGPRDRRRPSFAMVCAAFPIQRSARRAISLRTTFAFCRDRLRPAPICSFDSGTVFRFICKAIRNTTPRAVSRVSARHPRVRRARNGSLPCDAARLFRRSHRGRIKRISRACDARSRHPRRSEFSRCGSEVGA